MLKTPSVTISLRSTAGASLQDAAQVVHVRVLEHRLVRGPGQAHAVDDRGVVQAVGEDRRRHVAQGVEKGGVRVPARHVR